VALVPQIILLVTVEGGAFTGGAATHKALQIDLSTTVSLAVFK
jgi:hypothetical protein